MPGQSIAKHIQSLGFSQESAAKTEEMLLSLPDWENQHKTGRTTSRLKRENKTTRATGLSNMDVDNHPGKQEGDEGKQKEQRSQAIYPVAIAKGNPQQGPRSRSDLTGLRMFEEAASKTETPSKAESPTAGAATGTAAAEGEQKQGDCRAKPKPRSPKQKEAVQEAQQAAQQQGETFDTMPKPEVKEMAKKGGESKRKKPLPICGS